MSFREVGRRTDAPEATIRSRVNRLEQMGAVRLVAVTSAEFVLPAWAPAWIALNVHGGELESVANQLCERSEAFLVFTAVGRFNMLALLALPSRIEVVDFVTRIIAPLDGVYELEIWENVKHYKHDFRIAARLR